MKNLIRSLFVLFSFCAITVTASADDCGTGKLNYKNKNIAVSEEVEICKNEYSQFYAKKCANGCEFTKALKQQTEVEVEDATVGSPGGQICQELGFDSRLVEVEFKKTKTPHVDLCFGKDKDSFVSTGFLRDLKGSLE
ncbi:hypothetical protein CIK05_15375 [Bdellovibrio sp. qaytius]|nr:hypothetical protein CIK05_15375 [Bdellovibrio sp. qaytius]